MSTIWIVSEVPAVADTLGLVLRGLGAIYSGPAERAAWRERPAPDLVVLAPEAARPGELAGLEHSLEFLLGVPHAQSGAAGVLWVEPDGGYATAERVSQLIDDRPVCVSPAPLDPEHLLELARELLERPARPAALRARARRAWVTRQVELSYAGLELPALRLAVDPKNTRPVLLAGERGTRRGTLASYIHQLGEPLRDALVAVAAQTLRPGELEERLFASHPGARTTLYLQDLERAPIDVQRQLAHWLGAAGGLAVETLRWIASVRRPADLDPALRALPWVRVSLPPLRERTDRAELARALAAEWCERYARDVELEASAIEQLERYRWPGNLDELAQALDTTLSASRGQTIAAGELRIGPPPGERLVEAREELADPPAEPATAEIVESGKDIATAQGAEVTAETDASQGQKAAPTGTPGLRELLPPLAHEIRQPLLALRTYANLLDQRPDDEGVRRELVSLAGDDLVQLDQLLDQLELFSHFDQPRPAPTDLAALVSSELERRQDPMRKRSLVVLRELDQDAPPAPVDESWLRFALGVLLDRALRMVPRGGDLYIGSLYRPADDSGPARHRLLLRFHSPEEVLIGPEGAPGVTPPLEVVLARSLIERAGGQFAVDASGAQDNLILIELPA